MPSKTERDVLNTSRRRHLFREVAFSLSDPRKPPGVKDERIIIIDRISMRRVLRDGHKSPLRNESPILEGEVLECQSLHTNYISRSVRNERGLFIGYDSTYDS